jgi:hypothetical protein
VKREFGSIKKPMDFQILGVYKTEGGRTPNQMQVLKTSPRIEKLITEEEDERAALT